MGSFGGLPLRWHASLLVGLVIAGDFGVSPLAWLLYLGLVQCHLMAHGFAIRSAALTPIGIDIQGLGGKVRWRGRATPSQVIRAAWAGTLGQLVPMLIAKVILVAHGGATASWLVELERVAIHMNAVLIAVNLVPLPTFDGEVAWKVFALWRKDPIDSRRVVVLEVAKDSTAPAADDLEVAEAVAAELSAIARAHNDRAGVG